MIVCFRRAWLEKLLVKKFAVKGKVREIIEFMFLVIKRNFQKLLHCLLLSFPVYLVLVDLRVHAMFRVAYRPPWSI